MRRGGFAVLALLLACSRETQSPAPQPDAAPVAAAAAIAIEPPRLRVGDVAVVEVVVVTPPGYEVAPIRPPGAVPGLWLLDSEALAMEAAGAREIRRTRIRVRAREVGTTEWPPLAIEIEAPDGKRSTLATEARPLEVVSVLPAFPERTEPFAYRLPVAPAATTRPWVAAALGAGTTLAVLGVALLVRRTRRRARERKEALAAIASVQPWVEARRALALARSLPAEDWREAGAAGARALRRYLALRFDVDAAPSSVTEELAALRQPFVRAERWQAVLDCLRALDGERFRARPAAEAATRIAAALVAAEDFVRATSPEEGAR